MFVFMLPLIGFRSGVYETFSHLLPYLCKKVFVYLTLRLAFMYARHASDDIFHDFLRRIPSSSARQIYPLLRRISN
jgi:hypothetical protein